MFALLLSITFSANPSGVLWTPRTPFNLTSYPSLSKSSAFKILQLTDLHINTPAVCVLNAFAVSEILITSINPDLIVMTGDSVCNTLNGVSADLLIDFLDGFQIPYTFSLGNHDGEGGHDDLGIAKIFTSGSYSIFDRGPGSIHGYSNSAVNLLNQSGRLIYSLIMVDSNRYRDYSQGGGGYDYIYPYQGLWFEWFVNGSRKAAGSQIKNALFYHIPLPEINDVKADYEEVDPAGAAFAFREPTCPSGENSQFWQKVKDVGATSHMFFGHDHRNLLDYKYEGVNWVYGLKTGHCSYYDADRIGGTLITVGLDGNVSVEFVYAADVPVSERVTKLMAGKLKPRMRDVRPRKMK
jgi:3',5'-cyclic AMP phosphodiesterase CpdA